MADITAGMVKELRERTGLGMMDCKKALVEADGDMEKAIDDLRKASGLKAAKKAGRVAAEGIVMTRVSEDANFGVIVEVNSETDFVARDDNFLAFANAVIDAAFERRTQDVAELMAGELEDKREALVQKIGENISVRRIGAVNFKDVNKGIVDTYVHSNNRIAVLVALQVLGHPEDSAEITDILAHDDDIVVARHHHVMGVVQRLDHVHDGHFRRAFASSWAASRCSARCHGTVSKTSSNIELTSSKWPLPSVPCFSASF